jgi:uncharacterized membrane protein YccC
MAILLVAMGPGAALAQPARYDEAIGCAAANAVAAGILQSGSPTEEEQAQADDFQQIAEAWLGQAVSLSATGEDGAFADFNRASRDISDRIAASRADDALEGILGRPLEACNRLDSPFDDGLRSIHHPADPPPGQPV